MNENIIHKGFKPLCYMNENELIVFKNLKIYLCNITENVFYYICTIKLDILNTLMSKIRITQRIFRLEPRTAIQLNCDKAIISFKGYDYLIDIKQKTVKQINKYRQGMASVLSYTNITNISSVKKGLYFGEYLYNLDKEPVSIFYYNENEQFFSKAFTFEKGQINHIHYILEDVYRNRVWIFTGDFDNAAAIWYTNDDFKTVNLFSSGNQKYRSCMAFATEDGIIYATDTPFEQNYIRKITFNADKSTEIDLYKINGSSIYGTSIDNYLIWSTSVEPNFDGSTGLKSALSYKLDKGILGWNCELIRYNKTSGMIDLIDSYKKDLFPMRLCQFGSIMFPTGVSKDTLVYYGSAVNEIDGKMVICKIKENFL